jgi:hypothetical protein
MVALLIVFADLAELGFGFLEGDLGFGSVNHIATLSTVDQDDQFVSVNLGKATHQRNGHPLFIEL